MPHERRHFIRVHFDAQALLATATSTLSVQVLDLSLKGHCVGLLCRTIDLDSVTHLRRLIELQLGAPSLLERDLAELTAPLP